MSVSIDDILQPANRCDQTLDMFDRQLALIDSLLNISPCPDRFDGRQLKASEERQRDAEFARQLARTRL